MTTLRPLVRNVALLWMLIAALLVLLAVAWWHRSPAAPVIPPEVQKTLDSLRASKAHDDSTIATLRVQAVAARLASDSAASRARAYEAAAGRIGTRADTYASEARKSDPTAIPGGVAGTTHADSTARLWKMAYEERTYERDTLLLSLKASTQATADAQTAADKFRAEADASNRRLKAVEALNSDLADALTKASRGCRILGLRCPSRTETLAAGVLLGAVTIAATK